MSTIIQVENLCKTYRLGAIGGGTLRADVSRWLAKLRGKEDPNLQIGQEHHARLRGQEFKALQDVSFEVKQGEILGVIGRNGAGKSTLLKILSRVTAPTSGEVRVKGRIASLLEVGTGFHPELTGRENIFLNGAILGMSKSEIKRKFDEIVAFSEVEDFVDTPVKRYSSGMYVRLAFAVAAHLDPEILIVDEVLAVGDASFQSKCIGKMEDIAKLQNRTIIFVSHNMGAVRRLCTSGLVLKDGMVATAGPINHALEAYAESLSKNQVGLLDQHGRKTVLIHDVNFYINGLKCDSIATGETFEIKIRLDFDESVTKPVLVGFAIENLGGVFTMINYSNFQAVNFAPKKSVISATIADTPLAEGVYRLHVRILSGGKEIYWNTNLKEIRIEAGDFFGTGIRGEENLCPWLHKVKWNQVDV